MKPAPAVTRTVSGTSDAPSGSLPVTAEVDLLVRAYGRFQAEAALQGLPSGFSGTPGALGIFEIGRDGPGQGGRIGRGHQSTRDAVLDGLAVPTDVRRDDGPRRRHG